MPTKGTFMALLRARYGIKENASDRAEREAAAIADMVTKFRTAGLIAREIGCYEGAARYQLLRFGYKHGNDGWSKRDVEVAL